MKKNTNFKLNNLLSISKILLVITLLFFSKSILAQQTADRPNTYLVEDANNVWTTNASNQTAYNTEAKRKLIIYLEALSEKTANRVHQDLARLVPYATSQVSNEVVESGNIEADLASFRGKVVDGTFSFNIGTLNSIRVFGSDQRGTSYNNADAFDKRYFAKNMATADIETATHEKLHTYMQALLGDHTNSKINLTYTVLDTSTLPATEVVTSYNGKSLGFTGAIDRLHFTTASITTNPGNVALGGDGYNYMRIYNTDGTPSNYLVKIDINQLDNGASNNVANRRANAIATGGVGYEPREVVADPLIETPIPQLETAMVDAIEVLRLVNQSDYANLGFPLDDVSHIIPATLKFYPYQTGDAINNHNLNAGYSLEKISIGVPIAELPAGSLQFMCYSFDPNCLSSPSSSVLSIGTLKTLEFSVFPNPTKNTLNIQSNERLKNIIITDMQGRIIIEKSFNDYNTSIDLSNIEKGIYFANIYDTNNKLRKTEKVIKE